MTQAKKRAPRGAHVVMGNNSLRCMRCGHEFMLPTRTESSTVAQDPATGSYMVSDRMEKGLPIDVMTAYAKWFTSRHVGCKKDDPRGEARYAYSSPSEWFRSWDTGISSLALYAGFTGKGRSLYGNAGDRDPVPYDPDDFARCYRLLAVAPEWRARLGEVSQALPCWAPYVEAWDELESLWEEESPAGECPKLYERLQQIRAESEVRP